jgi:caffeic acid 3-O-methyltransferase
VPGSQNSLGTTECSECRRLCLLAIQKITARKFGEMEVTTEVQETAVEAFYVMQELNYIYSVPLALKAALELRIPDILAEAGPGASLTPQQIADKLPRKSHDAAQKVGRILRLLAHKGVFAEVEAPESEPSYGLTDVSKYFVTGSAFELTPYAIMMQRREIQAPLNHLRETVEDDANGFVLANGSDMWTYGSAHPDFNDVFNASMQSRSKLLNTIISRYYEGFKHVQCLVDVGGGVGGALTQIVAAHPHIRGRNFDLPHVISTAPQIPGKRSSKPSLP